MRIMEKIKDLQADEATAKIGEGSAVVKYYREARAALSYPPVMTLDNGGEYPTSHIIQVGAGGLHTLAPKKPTAMPLPDDLRPTAIDWQPIVEVTPSATAIDCGGLIMPGPQGSTVVSQPHTVQIAWDGAIRCHLCRLPYSPLKSWPWRRWFGDAGRLPMYIDGVGGVTYHPRTGESLTLQLWGKGDSGVLWRRDAFPAFSILEIGGVDFPPAAGVSHVTFESGTGSNRAVTFSVYEHDERTCWWNMPVVFDLTGFRHTLFVAIDNADGLPQSTSFYVGVYSHSSFAGRLALTGVSGALSWECTIKASLVGAVPTGCDIHILNKGDKPMSALSWWHITLTDVVSSTSAFGVSLMLIHQNVAGLASYSFAAVVSDLPEPPVNPYTGTYSPVTLSEGEPDDAVTVPSAGNSLPLPTADTMASGWLTPSDMRERGYNVGTSVFSVPCVVPMDWDGSHDMPTDEFVAKMQAKSDEWGCIVTYPYHRYAPAVFAGVYTDGDLRVGVRWNPYTFGSHAHAFSTLPKSWAGKTMLIGYREDDTETVLGSRHVLQGTGWNVLAEGEYVETETVAPIGAGHNVIHWYSFKIPPHMPAAFLIGRYETGFMRIEQRRDFPVPFAPAFASIRTNWPNVLRAGGMGGRLTGLTLPACAYDIVLHWWSEDGKSYALPFKAVAVERSASAVSETRRDAMAADLLSSQREQYNTMRCETLTRYRCAMELDEEEQRAAATLAESPFFCYTTAEDEDTRHWCEVDGVKTEWTATEAATIEITIKDI